MARFTLTVDLRAFTPETRDGLKVVVVPEPDIYPVAGSGVHVRSSETVTSSAGVAEFDLVSLAGLTYTVSCHSVGLSMTIPGDWPDGSVKRLDELVTVTPSPIAATDAAAVLAQAEVAAEAKALEVVAPLDAELDTKETPAGAQAKASTAEANAKAYADTALVPVNEELSGRLSDAGLKETIASEVGTPGTPTHESLSATIATGKAA